MTAYVISEVEPRDAALFARYRAMAPATIERYGGRYIVRGGEADVVEGGPPAKTIVIVAFPSMAQAREWYRSPEYAACLKVRADALERRLIFVEGVPPAS
jgi:uncharacterized protein (DUF1330 family)